MEENGFDNLDLLQIADQSIINSEKINNYLSNMKLVSEVIIGVACSICRLPLYSAKCMRLS